MTKRRGNRKCAAGAYASPLCVLHELDPAYPGVMPKPDAQQRAAVMAWRKAERQPLNKRLARDMTKQRCRAKRTAARRDKMVPSGSGWSVDPGGAPLRNRIQSLIAELWYPPTNAKQHARQRVVVITLAIALAILFDWLKG